ncbi:MAG TPA: hypothetical protein VHO94_05240 [Oscillospiraceae bacterium]|nr:hypothetical protein [Oscillospiraceae bacterium]
MKSRNWFWGLFFILAAVFVIASQIGSFGQIGMLSILATVLLAALLIHSVMNRNFFGIFLPVALLYMIYQKPLGLVAVNLWILLIAVLLVSIGFSCIFRTYPDPKKWKCCSYEGTERFNQTSENIDDNNPYTKVAFGSASKYLHADCLKGGQFIVSFGALEVFYDQAQLSPEGAKTYLDCSFGEMKLYIPRGWRVIDNVRASLGSVENDVRLSQPAADAPQLTLTGNVSFGSIEIHYI